MLIVVKNGTLSEAEQDAYVRYISEKFPPGAVEKLILEVDGGYINMSWVLHEYREARKMTGYLVSDPAHWNEAKRAELRDTLPNPAT